MGVKTPRDFPKLPIPISDVIRPSMTMPPMYVGKVSLRALYNEGWSNTEAIPANILAILYNSGDSNCAIWSFVYAYLAQTFRFLPVFLIKVTTFGMFGKLLGSSVNDQSTEVHLTSDVKRPFL